MLFVTCPIFREEKVGLRCLGGCFRCGPPRLGCGAWRSLESLLVSGGLASGVGDVDGLSGGALVVSQRDEDRRPREAGPPRWLTVPLSL